jgi:hypothetical protein
MMKADLPTGIKEETLHRIYSEYLEMPGLRLTRQQAQRLWGLDEETCSQSLECLVEAGFLVRTRVDSYVRLTDGATSFPRLRMAQAAFVRSDERRGRSRVS